MTRLVVTLTIGCLLAAPAAWAHNENTAIILHVVDDLFPDCDQAIQDGADCVSGSPVTDATGMANPSVIMYLRSYDRVTAVQAAFTWGPGWTLLAGSWQCQVAQLSAIEPSAPGATNGSIATAFNPISGGVLEPIGFMTFVASSGCLEIIESSFPNGTHVVDIGHDPAEQHIDMSNWGRICVGSGGSAPCVPDPLPIEPSSWGAIKAQYN